jgi:hyaluronoglucosaminidase
MMLVPSTITTAPFPLYWNVGEQNPPPVDVTQWGFTSRNYTQVGNECSNPGCRPWTQGLFPTINDTGEKINGGVPQAGNLSLHLNSFKEGVLKWIPDEEWSGNAVLDFEAWTTIWEENSSPDNWHGKRYQNESIRIVREKQPSLNSTEIVAVAKREFEIAATEWFVKSLELGRSLRPNAKWGFYGLPSNTLGKCSSGGGSKTHSENINDVECSYDGPDGLKLKNYAERQSAVWNASDALFPSIYYPDVLKGLPNNATAYVKAVITESVKLANGKNVYAYGWHAYHSGNNLIPVNDVINMMNTVKESGASGIVWWGPSSWNKTLDYWSKLSNSLGPKTKDWCDQQKGGCLIK